MNKSKISRIIGLDFLRIFLIFMVFVFHLQMHFSCSFSIFNYAIKVGASLMSVFFMLSGFLIYRGYNNLSFEKQSILAFYKKRFIAIVPLYLFVAFMFIIFIGKETLIENLALAPYEILGIQTWFTGLFSFTHNGGTWFISCILLCYIIFPLVLVILKNSKKSARIIVFIVLIALLFLAPFITRHFALHSIYDNPLFRCLEFILGVLVASFNINFGTKARNNILGALIATISIIAFFVCASYIVNTGLFINDYSICNILIPLFLLMLIGFSLINSSSSFWLTKVIMFLSKICYSFYLAQFFTWPICTNYLQNNLQLSNFKFIILAFVICFIIAILLYYSDILIKYVILKLIKRSKDDQKKS